MHMGHWDGESDRSFGDVQGGEEGDGREREECDGYVGGERSHPGHM